MFFLSNIPSEICCSRSVYIHVYRILLNANHRLEGGKWIEESSKFFRHISYFVLKAEFSWNGLNFVTKLKDSVVNHIHLRIKIESSRWISFLSIFLKNEY